MKRPMILLGGLGVALALSGFTSPDTRPAPDAITLCLTSLGTQVAAVCRNPGGSQSGYEGFCVCPIEARQVAAPPCPEGEDPPTPNREYERARMEAARDGSLYGDSYNGQAMCLRPRDHRG
ncbi:hypothetical protein Q0812_02985 [Brevundimonas sp. 2R-24]|uniref:Secreted protein n=1 Tax=Peiella sedimenti TaxID=3061083 RepID=A0ABT8SJ33_9CAUL|nr:hypothetical protein [Caulobacteraceae bacterium XZ-24]